MSPVKPSSQSHVPSRVHEPLPLQCTQSISPVKHSSGKLPPTSAKSGIQKLVHPESSLTLSGYQLCSQSKQKEESFTCLSPLGP